MDNSTTDFSGKIMSDDVKGILNRSGDSFDKLVEFGLKLIDWDFNCEGVEKQDGYLVPIFFLRNFVENIDAMSILIRQGASDPCKSLLRTVLENYFSLEYLLENPHERSMAFHVWNTYHNYKLYEKLDGNSESAKQLMAILKKDKLLNQSTPLVYEKVEELKANSKQILALDLYKKFAEEYERTKIKVKNPYWYSLYNGPTSVESLATHLKLTALYEVYRGLSNNVHGNDIIQGKISKLSDGRLGILQLRFPKEADTMTQYAHNLCIGVFQKYVSARVPEKQDELKQWFLSIKPFRDELTKRQSQQV